MAEFLGVDVHTVARGRRELFGEQVHRERVRKEGGGRKAAEKKTPKVIKRIADLLKHETAGDPIHGLKWTRKTTRKVARQLRRLKILISAKTVGRLLKKTGFSLRVNHKKLESGNKNPPPRRIRNQQFKYPEFRRFLYTRISGFCDLRLSGYPLASWSR